MKNLNLDIFINRRHIMSAYFKENAPSKKWVIFLIANFEKKWLPFRQESSFYYFTGLYHPGLMIGIDIENNYHTTLFISKCKAHFTWEQNTELLMIQENPKKYGFDTLIALGEPFITETPTVYADIEHYENVLDYLSTIQSEGKMIATILPPQEKNHYVDQLTLWWRFSNKINDLFGILTDMEDNVADMRAIKSENEIDLIVHAIEIIKLAHRDIVDFFTNRRDGLTKKRLQAVVQHVMSLYNGKEIASATNIFSQKSLFSKFFNNKTDDINNGDLILVEIVAETNMYCGKLTRTYPVSGTFTPKQRELYNLVVEVERYVASIAKIGLWLKNDDYPEESLHHLAQAFLEKNGHHYSLARNIGHYIGLDPYDFIDYPMQLDEGYVFTIEPTLYEKDKSYGICIANVYLMTENGVQCLVKNLPRTSHEIEAFIANLEKNYQE